MRFPVLMLLLLTRLVIRHELSQAQVKYYLLEKATNPGEVLTEFDERDYQIKGHYFIREEWDSAWIIMKNGLTLGKYPVRFDLREDVLELKIHSVVKVIPYNRIDTVRINFLDHQRYYIYGKDLFYSDDGEAISGLCEIQASGIFGLLCKYDYEVKKADYVPALDIGSKSEEVLIQKKMYILKEGRASRIPYSRSAFIKLFENSAGIIDKYCRTNKLNHRSEHDLRQIMAFIYKNI